jgi:hypothetical protein
MNQCPVCGAILHTQVCSGQKRRKCLMLFCPTDGRHFRAFINEPAVVRIVEEESLSLEEAVARRTETVQ